MRVKGIPAGKGGIAQLASMQGSHLGVDRYFDLNDKFSGGRSKALEEKRRAEKRSKEIEGIRSWPEAGMHRRSARCRC